MFKLRYFRGRVALSKILSGLGVHAGDDVVIQAFTCTAVPEAVFSVGAKPVYVDVENNGVNMAPEKLEKILNENVNVKAIVVQHTFGIPAQIDKIAEISEKYNIPLIEDCAHTFKTSVNGKGVGTWGVASFYSFEWGKPIIAGIGGSLVLNNGLLSDYVEKDYSHLKEPGVIFNIKSAMQILAFKLLYHPKIYWILKDLFHFFSKYGLAIGNYSKVKSEEENEISEDFGLKMPMVNRLWLNYSISHLEKSIIQRKNISDYYFKVFTSADFDKKILPDRPEIAEIYYARFPLIVKNKDLLLREARRNRIEISGWYETPVHPLEGEQLKMAGYMNNSCPNAEKLCKSLISLPVNSKISKSDIDKYAIFLKGYMT